MEAAALERARAAPFPSSMLGDKRLARMAARGDRPAFAAIFRRYHQPIYRYCRSIVRDPERAQDALQNTMERAMLALPGERREIALKPWLFRIAHNESVRLLETTPPAEQLDGSSEVAAISPDPERREELRNLLDDLGQLGERQRGALVMRELNGLGYAQISAALQTSQAGAKQAVYEARIALHELAEGREMSCKDAKRSISADDRRILRGRKLRAHLRGCADCRAFEMALRERPRQLAAVAPPLPAVAAAAVMGNLFGGGGGGAGGGGLVPALGGGGRIARSSLAARAGVATMVTFAVGAGMLVGSVASDGFLDPPWSSQHEEASLSAAQSHGLKVAAAHWARVAASVAAAPLLNQLPPQAQTETTSGEPGSNGHQGAGGLTAGQLLNAAHECKAQRSDSGFADAHGGLSFSDYYGTNHNQRNAFGKCVSRIATAQQNGSGGDQAGQGDTTGSQGPPNNGSGGPPALDVAASHGGGPPPLPSQAAGGPPSGAAGNSGSAPGLGGPSPGQGSGGPGN